MVAFGIHLDGEGKWLTWLKSIAKRVVLIHDGVELNQTEITDEYPEVDSMVIHLYDDIIPGSPYEMTLYNEEDHTINFKDGPEYVDTLKFEYKFNKSIRVGSVWSHMSDIMVYVASVETGKSCAVEDDALEALIHLRKRWIKEGRLDSTTRFTLQQ